jgi:hypothetical protein
MHPGHQRRNQVCASDHPARHRCAGQHDADPRDHLFQTEKTSFSTLKDFGNRRLSLSSTRLSTLNDTQLGLTAAAGQPKKLLNDLLGVDQ